MTGPPLTTPDGRYLVVRGRLWRCSDPGLTPERRDELTRELMRARRDKQTAMRREDRERREDARARVDAAKRALGERGPVWWSDGAPDLTRHLARTTPYADWYASLAEAPEPPEPSPAPERSPAPGHDPDAPVPSSSGSSRRA
ncbi:biopolymer transporter Tol [Cellulomonas sp. NS3]|uniref:biopolymer transporter Tol n=1 Tax=Cellulomonas sp. NS3 TaxID=2973977 RepID=UPI002161DC00|nr:biopolymer transporter Tol [Cellulomonas sp. NS3]